MLVYQRVNQTLLGLGFIIEAIRGLWPQQNLGMYVHQHMGMAAT